MASVTACSRLLVLTCGDRVAVLDFSCPEEATILNLPQIPNAAPHSKPPHNGKLKSKREVVLNEENKNVGTKGSEHDSSSDGANRILAVDVSSDGQYLALGDDHKYLHVFQRSDSESKSWRVVSSRCVSRRCTTVKFDDTHGKVLLADKSGDVFSFPIHPGDPANSGMTSGDDPEMKQSQQEGQRGQGDGQARETDQSQEDTSGGQLVLGHLSMLLDLIVLGQDDLVITADRNEKIRISRYPDAYNIHTYCLGHTEFVISLALDSDKRLLFSGSGDCTIRVWDYVKGRQLTQRSCLDDLPPRPLAVDETNDETNDEAEKNTSGTSKFQPAVQQISYCQDCRLLFVAMNRSPDILVYQLVPAADQNGVPSLVPHPTIKGQGEVVSLCIQGCILWCIREGDDGPSQLKLVATKVDRSEDGFQMTTLTSERGDGHQSKILQTMSKHADFFKDAPARLDLSILWKSHIDGYVDQYLERKRQRIESKEAAINDTKQIKS